MTPSRWTAPRTLNPSWQDIAWSTVRRLSAYSARPPALRPPAWPGACIADVVDDDDDDDDDEKLPPHLICGIVRRPTRFRLPPPVSKYVAAEPRRFLDTLVPASLPRLTAA
jgi:hypothetical protein